MPPRDWRLRIEDMLDAADAIEKFVKGGDFDTFRGDRKTVDAVVRNLEVMGEAARHVPDSIRQKFADIRGPISWVCGASSSTSTSGLISRSFGTLYRPMSRV